MTKRYATIYYLIKMLNKYGNTILSEDPKKYFDGIEMNGHTLYVTKIKNIGEKGYHYLIEDLDWKGESWHFFDNERKLPLGLYVH